MNNDPRLLPAAELFRLIRTAQDESLPAAERVAARNTVVERNVGLANKVLASFRLRTRSMRPDLRQECHLALVRAADSYDPVRGVKFSSYACQSMFYGVRKALQQFLVPYHVPERQWWGHYRAVKNRPTPLVHEGYALDELPGGDYGPGVMEAADEAERLLDRLLPRDREVVCRRFGIGRDAPETYTQIGQEMGFSRQLAERICKQAMARLTRDAERRSRRAG